MVLYTYKQKITINQTNPRNLSLDFFCVEITSRAHGGNYMNYEIMLNLASGKIMKMRTSAKNREEAKLTAHMYMNMYERKGKIVSVKEVK